MRKLINIFLLIITSLTFIACGNINEKNIAGTWQTQEIEILNIDEIINSFSEKAQKEFTEAELELIIERLNQAYISDLNELNYIFNKDNSFFIDEEDEVHKWRLDKKQVIIQRQNDAKDMLNLEIQSITKNELIFILYIKEEITLQLQITCIKNE